jgi:apolipoprotein N-acyltransferase
MIFNRPFSRIMLSLYSGMIMGVSYPPGVGFFALFGLVPLIRVWLISSPLTSLKYSFISSLFCSLISLYWIGLNSGASIIPVLISLIAAILYLSIYWAIIGYFISWLQKRFFWTIYLIPFIWVSMEFLKSYGPLAFSWSSLALTQTNFLPLLQIAEYTGSEGISFWVVLINIAIYMMLYNNKQIYKINIVLIFFIIFPFLYGLFKINFIKESQWNKKAVSIIQPNIDPNLKWESSFRDELYRTMDSLNVLAYELSPDLVLWPEAALPNYMRVSYVRKRYEKIAVDKSIPLMMGTLDYKTKDGARLSLNGSIYFDGSDKNKMYHKLFLVPFAEYIPLSSHFSILKKLNFGQGNFIQGNEYSLFKLDSLLFSNLICYDLSNPLVVKNFITKGARFLTVQANVAWLQNSSGVRQFFEIAKLRAVENRTGIAISANTGISGIINPLGVATHKILFNEQEVIKGEVFLNNKVTFYSKYGNVFSKICFLFSILCFVFVKLKRI